MVKSIFTSDEIKFIEENYSKMDANEIGKLLGKTRKQIKGKADTLNIRKGIIVEKYSNEEVTFIEKNYNLMHTKDIANALNRTVKQINDKAYNLGLRRELLRYEYDESFFEEINNEEKAYWLGFIYADGCISEIFNKKTGALKSRTMELTLSKIDEVHLMKFLLSIKSNKPIEQKLIKLNGNEYKACKTSINNKKICDDLINLGCIPRKSLTIDFPKENVVPRYLIRHFIRGYFDGDGCVSFNHDNLSYIVNFVGTESILSGIQDFVEKENSLFRTVIRGKGKAFQVSWGGFTNFKLWYELLYKDSNIFLDRKHIKFLEAIETKKYTRDVAYYHRNMSN